MTEDHFCCAKFQYPIVKADAKHLQDVFPFRLFNNA